MFDDYRSDVDRFRDYGARGSSLRLILANQGLWAMACYRAGRYLLDHRPPPVIRQVIGLLYQVWWKLVQMATGIYICPTVRIGKGFYIGHFGQIFLGGDTVIGQDCNVSQGVTVGWGVKDGKKGVPSMGDRVYIAPGAKVIGPIYLASGTVVGANAVVTKDTEENAVVVGVPARVLHYKGSADYIP